MSRIVAFCSLAILLIGCHREPATPAAADVPAWSQQERLLYYGIPVRVLFSPADDDLEAAVWRQLEAIDDDYNDWRNDTTVSRINAAPIDEPIKLDPEFAAVWSLCRRVHDATDGAFDPTVRPLRQLWRAAAKTNVPPTAAAIAAARERCGIDKIAVDEKNLLRKHRADVALDFGGVIKGVAVDQATRSLERVGCPAALLQIGGETAVWGISQRGKPHAIAIQHPLDMQAFWTVLEDPGSGFSCATSGNYRNPIKIGDQTYYHVFDPRTGQPVDTDILSVTILFPEAGKNGLADALSTAGAVLGAERTLKIAAEFGAEALVLTRDGDQVRERATPGFAAFRRP